MFSAVFLLTICAFRVARTAYAQVRGVQKIIHKNLAPTFIYSFTGDVRCLDFWTFDEERQRIVYAARIGNFVSVDSGVAKSSRIRAQDELYSLLYCALANFMGKPSGILNEFLGLGFPCIRPTI